MRTCVICESLVLDTKPDGVCFDCASIINKTKRQLLKQQGSEIKYTSDSESVIPSDVDDYGRVKTHYYG